MRQAREQWSDLEEWARASIRAARGESVDPRLEYVDANGAVQAVLSGETVSQGGALVPVELADQLQIMPTFQAPLGDFCRTWQMGSNKRNVPAMYSNDHDSDAPFGARMRWTGDTRDLSTNKKDPQFTSIGLEAKNLDSYIEVKTTFVEDSAVELIDVMNAVYSAVMTWELNRMIIRGAGAGQPSGIIGAPATVTVTRSTANQIGDADIDALVARMLPGCAENAMFLAFPGAVADTIDRVGGRALLTNETFPFARRVLAGYPLIQSEHCSTLGTAGDLMLVDLAAYYVGVRQQVMVAMSGLGSGFTKHQTGVRVTARLDGQPGMSTAIDPAQGADTQSAFVVLGTI